jgi:NADH-quinone oxidoreductase subunit M
MLLLYWRVIYGTHRTAEAASMRDLNAREWVLLAPIAAVVLWMGVYPESFMAPMRKDVGVLLARIERAAPAGDAQLAMGAGRPVGPVTHGTPSAANNAEGPGHPAPAPSGAGEAH